MHEERVVLKGLRFSIQVLIHTSEGGEVCVVIVATITTTATAAAHITYRTEEYG